MRIACRVLIVVCLFAVPARAQSVGGFTVAWDHSPDPDAVGYNLYITTFGGGLVYQRDVMRGTQFTYAAPAYGVYCAALRSYNAGATVGPLSEQACITLEAPSSPPPQETCNPDGTGNGVDEDGDGQIDEGCTAPPPPPPPPPPSGDTIAPSVTISISRNGRSQNYSITGRATDDVGVVIIQLFANNSPTPFASCATQPVTFCSATVKLGRGSYVVRVLATDAAGNVGEASATVTN
jgi:hypothetical protein